MISVFIDQEDEFTVDFYIGKNKEGKLFIKDSEAEIKSINKEIEVEKHYVVFKRPSFGDIVNIASNFYGNQDGEFSFNAMNDKLKKTSFLLKRWSFNDKDDKEIIPNEKQVRALNPLIADYISDKLVDEIGVIFG
jgi:hypothetical protein